VKSKALIVVFNDLSPASVYLQSRSLANATYRVGTQLEPFYYCYSNIMASQSVWLH